MSYLEQVQQLGPNEYLLPRVGGMKVEVRAFLSEKLFAQTDEALWRQAAEVSCMPGAIGMYLLPDTHLGYHLPVGGVLVTEDVLVQAGSGYDISCGIVHLQVPGLSAVDVVSPEKRRWWIEATERRVATGLGSEQVAKQHRFSRKQLDEILHFGGKAIGVSEKLCERQFIPIPADVNFREIPKAYDRAAAQLGSVGGGNHFIEMQVDAADGSVWVMVHCGSRGFGWQAANEFFYRGAELRDLPKNRREEAWLRADEDLGKLYWAWHNAAANYAVANRWTIVEGVNDALEEVFGVRGAPFFEISHNLVQEETLVLPDGTTKKGFVHRKGATRAFPAGHPDLVGSKWEASGHPCLIPGSMFDGAAILMPLQGAYRSGCSVNHGSGRVMGRGHAKRELKVLHDDIDAEMQNVVRSFGPDQVKIRGVLSNTRRTPLDECHHVYKDLDDVLAVLEDEGIAKVERRLWPVANLKGTD